MSRLSEPKPNKRLPLGFKWTAVVAAGIFSTFIVLSLILLALMRQVLINQERDAVAETMSAVQSRLAPAAKNLTAQAVLPRINADNTAALSGTTAAGQPANSVFDDSVVQKISRADMSLAVYDRAGHKLFTSRDSDEPLVQVAHTVIKMTNNGRFKGMIARAPVISSQNGKRIGYAQITDHMATFYATMRQLWGIVAALAAAALLVSMALGFFLASRFLKPIRSITKTIDQINEEPQSSARIPPLRRNDELSDLVDEFNAMLDRIQRFIDQQGEFVQDVSHELRTPVAVLEGHLQLLNRWGKDDPEVLNESLTASLQEVKRMKSLIQEMLELTRADSVDVQFPNATVDINEVIQQVVNDMRMIHPDFVFTLDNDLEGPVFVRMYRNHLEQILIILLDNGVKYSTKRKELHVSAALDSDGVALAVQDFGEGIAPKDRERVFNRFYRVDKARSREKGGNGLGLSIAQQLIESYHGAISVDSALGSGSVFRIQLPTITAETASRLQAQETALQSANEPAPEIKSNL
ncbi:ATP-binding protein [Lacticaseibacillus jixianensis]|uniref:Signal transduction histidine-protein kinase ArlS n=1 Tax=Lacticaseibacillus jixianensis TaxID=2486012 RepID=A0ABW4BBK4_9LACO|nr:HAMP domain-containing histidine kinase [Lacticaseibacillus jixianensis]